MNESLRISRQFSQRAVMEAIVQNGPISRASIAKQTGLSKQTISEIVRQLEIDGWVQETGRTSGHIGRSAVTYELIPDAAYIAAVDLGGTKVRVAIADLACQVFAEEVAPTDKRGGRCVVEQIAALCWQAADRNGIPRDRIRIKSIGSQAIDGLGWKGNQPTAPQHFGSDPQYLLVRALRIERVSVSLGVVSHRSLARLSWDRCSLHCIRRRMKLSTAGL